ncbi:hypothetical protein AHiyo8_52190 [Arthrobacter sp. Hiyo8]|nr:hypothetical protein AHiyo8_52190 [Arthrobacter sp. Hiyo8]
MAAGGRTQTNIRRRRQGASTGARTLDLPEAPKPLGKPTLKPASAPSAGPSVQVQHGKPQSALSNLDDVLQRRRA